MRNKEFWGLGAKFRYNGNPNVITVDPEIHHINLADENNDFIILGCDGIFDRLSTEHSC